MNADGKPRIPKNRIWQPVTIRWLTAMFGVCLLYADVLSPNALASDTATGDKPTH